MIAAKAWACGGLELGSRRCCPWWSGVAGSRGVGGWMTAHQELPAELHATGHLDWSRAVRGRAGRPRRRPDELLADRGYDHDKYRRLGWAKGIKPTIARRGTPHGSGLGRHRYAGRAGRSPDGG